MEDQTKPEATQENPVEIQEQESKKVSYDSYRKLLNEKKSTQAKMKEMAEKLEKIELERLEQENDYKKQAETWRAKYEETKNNYSSLKKDVAFNTIKSQVTAKAASEGCVNTEKFFKLLDPNDLQTLEVGEDFSINQDSLDELIAKAKQEHADIGLFRKSEPQVHDVHKPHTPQGKSIAEMSIEELKQAILS